MTKAIGILGGTFDPIHYGHLRPALDVADVLALSDIHLIPNAVPPHRPQPEATAEQRLNMLQLAVDSTSIFQVDERELNREGLSYTYDTLLSLRNDLPDTALYLLVGTDAFLHIQSWYRWQQLLDIAHIVVMHRPGDLPEMNPTTQDWYQQHLATKADKKKLHGKIWPVAVTQLMISATAIRTLIADDKNPRYLLPDAVISYIQHTGIYKR